MSSKSIHSKKYISKSKYKWLFFKQENYINWLHTLETRIFDFRIDVNWWTFTRKTNEQSLYIKRLGENAVQQCKLCQSTHS